MPTHPAPLTSAFAFGWRKLPNELKLEVMSYVLPYNRILNVLILTETARRSKQRTASDPTDIQQLWFLLEHPDFSDLTIDFLFGNNQFRVQARLSRYQCPVASISSKVKRVQLVVAAFENDWRWLADFAKGIYGFDELRDVEIVLDGGIYFKAHWASFCQQIHAEGVILWDVERLRMRYRGWEDCEPSVDMAELETLVGRHVMRRKDAQLGFVLAV